MGTLRGDTMWGQSGETEAQRHSVGTTWGQGWTGETEAGGHSVGTLRDNMGTLKERDTEADMGTQRGDNMGKVRHRDGGTEGWGHSKGTQKDDVGTEREGDTMWGHRGTIWGHGGTIWGH